MRPKTRRKESSPSRRADESAPRSGRASRAAALLVLAVASLATGACAPPPERGFSIPESGAPIRRFARVDDGLYRGGYPVGRLDFLKKRGIRTVVNLRSAHDYRAEAEAAGLNYVHIPLSAGKPPSAEAVRRFLAVVTDPANRPVYVHCRRGADRTGAMVAVYRIAVCGWSAERAVREMESFGFASLLYGRLRKYVLHWRPQGAPAPASR